MSDAISRAIALAHEPEPEVTDAVISRDACLEYDRLESPGYWWYFGAEGTIKKPVYKWFPVEITDPEISMRLLKELLVDSDVELNEIDGQWFVRLLTPDNMKRGDTLELAIARAWLEAKRIEVKE